MRKIALLTTLCLSACATTATVKTLDSEPMEVELISSDEQTLRVRTTYQMTDVPRDRVTYIDHPGNAHITTGLVIGGIGVMQTVIGFILLTTDEPIEVVTGQIGGGVVFMGVGGAIAWWGHKTWRRSKRATEPTGHTIPLDKEDQKPSIVFAPLVIKNERSTHAGLKLSFGF